MYAIINELKVRKGRSCLASTVKKRLKYCRDLKYCFPVIYIQQDTKTWKAFTVFL